MINIAYKINKTIKGIVWRAGRLPESWDEVTKEITIYIRTDIIGLVEDTLIESRYRK